MASATYDAGNRLATWGGISFSDDPNGNLTSDGATTYAWNARHQLASLSGGASASFAYDGLGRRRGKTVSGTTTNFLYDGLNFVQELTSGGTPTANLLTGLGIDETFTRTDAGGASTLLTDALGSTLELADASGTLQTHNTFEPFGATSAAGATSTNAQQYAGRENDATGLYFSRARYYAPGLQRFLGEDPLGVAGGVNVYAYVGNQPTLWSDPLGLKPSARFGGAGFSGSGANGGGGGGNGGGSGAGGSGGGSGSGSQPRGSCESFFCRAISEAGSKAAPMAKPVSYAEIIAASAAGGVAAQILPEAGAFVRDVSIQTELTLPGLQEYLTDAVWADAMTGWLQPGFTIALGLPE